MFNLICIKLIIWLSLEGPESAHTHSHTHARKVYTREPMKGEPWDRCMSVN